MRVGTKSILFGAHCFFIHPIFVALAWWKLYGFPTDYRLWVAFFVHDLGYWGKSDMDGPTEGELHPYWAANLMHKWFDKDEFERMDVEGPLYSKSYYWHNFCLYHSRFLAKKHGANFSKLCVADKLSTTLEPWWLYLPRIILTGEIKEYMSVSEVKEGAKYASMRNDISSKRKWFDSMCTYLGNWVEEHKDLRPDTWTPEPECKLLSDEEVENLNIEFPKKWPEYTRLEKFLDTDNLTVFTPKQTPKGLSPKDLSDAAAALNSVLPSTEKASDAFDRFTKSMAKKGWTLVEEDAVKAFDSRKVPCPTDGPFLGIYLEDDDQTYKAPIEMAWGVLRVECYGGPPNEIYGWTDADGNALDEPPYWRELPTP